MADTTDNSKAQTTLDGAANNTGATDTGAATQTATTTATSQDITQTDEFKNALTAAIEKKIPQLKKQLAKQLTGEGEGTQTVEELQRQLQEAQKTTRTFEARESIRDFLSDPKNQLPVKSQDMAGAVALISQHLEFEDDGTIKNLKQAVDRAKTLAPSLFAQASGHINQGSGNKPVDNKDMNAFIRQQHAAKYN